MDFISNLLYDLFFDYTLRTVALGTAIIGIVSGALGCFALLRRQSLLGDAISHATLPGVALAFLLTDSKEPIVLILGGIISGWLATRLIEVIVRYTRIKEDSALGISLSIFFGFGLVLLALVQTRPNANQAGLDRFLFGQAAAIVERDLLTMGVLSFITLSLMLLFWKEFKLLSFDPEYAASLGFPIRWLDLLLTTLLVVAIVIGLQAVGVILMSAMVVAPAAAARQWTNRLGLMVFLAALFGAISGLGGAIVSSLGTGLGTGPVIVLFISAIVLVSLLIAPNRGLIWQWLRQRRNKRQLRLNTVLSDLYALSQQHAGAPHAHSLATLQTMNVGRGGVTYTLKQLEKKGLVQQNQVQEWRLTAKGLTTVEQLLQETNADINSMPKPLKEVSL